MHQKGSTSKLAALLLLLIGLPAIATAQTAIAIQNPSFENGATGWTGCLIWSPPAWGYPASAIPDGKAIGYLNGGMCTQDLGITASALTTYTLKFYIGHRLDGWTITTTVKLLAGSTSLCSVSVDSLTITAGTFALETLACPTGATPPSGDLIISISSPSLQANFDNFSLTSAPIGPPPQSINLALSGNLSFDDGTTVTGSVAISQVIPTNTNNMLGQFTPDGQGNISATVSLMTNFADICTFNFYLLDATGKQVGFMQQQIPGVTFNLVHSITGFKIVLGKSSCAAGNCTLAPGSTMGTLGS